MNKYLIQQLELHQNIEAQDIMKLAYQVCFGVEHIILDNNKAKEYLETEYNSIDEEDDLLFEEISKEYIRVNLGTYKYLKLDLEKLYKAFIDSNEDKHKTREDFELIINDYLETIEKLDKDLHLKLKEFYKTYIKEGINPIHHSENYRKGENPHYRVVKKDKIIDYLRQYQ